MSASTAFQVLNTAALVGWIVLIVGVVRRGPRTVAAAGRWWPLGLAIAYVSMFFLPGPTDGGFSSIAGVRALFQADWTLVAGWTHYLAFDLFVGGWAAAETLRLGLPRAILIVVLPLTFLAGPAGYLLFEILRRIFQRRDA